VLLNFYIPDIANDRIKLVKITAKIHLIPNLKAKMLIGVNIIKTENMNISFSSKTLTIAGENEWVTDIQIHAKDIHRIRRTVIALESTVIPSQSIVSVPINLRSFDKKARIYAHKKNSAFPKNRDFLFKPEYPGAYVHLINADVHHIYVKNDTDLPMRIDRKNRLGKLVKMEKEFCQFLDKDSHNLAAFGYSNSEIDHARPAVNHNENIPVFYGANVHRDARPNEFNQMVIKYPNLFIKTGRLIEIPEKIWIKIRFKENWEITGAKFNYKFYSLPVNEQAIVNETLNKIHEQEKLEWT
jgi:hypothetical protein